MDDIALTQDHEPAVDRSVPRARPANAFLLSQLGEYTARRFAERVAELDLSPAQAGLLRMVAQQPGQSQQTIAKQLGAPPSRLVALVDDLEDRGLVERRRSPEDRRVSALHLTADGGRIMGRLAAVGRAHEEDLCVGLDDAERAMLTKLLSHIATEHAIAAHVHPGYRALGR